MTSNNLCESNFSLDFLEYKSFDDKFESNFSLLVRKINQLFFQRINLDQFLEKINSQESDLWELRIKEFFLCFLKQEFRPFQNELDQLFEDHSTCFLEVEDNYGFDYLSEIFIKHRKSQFQEQVVNLKLPEFFTTANQIALYLLKETESLGKIVSDPLTRVKQVLKKNCISVLLEFRDLKKIKPEEISNLLGCLEDTSLIIKAPNLSSLSEKIKSLIKKKIVIKKLSDQSASELIESLLKFRPDFVVTSANRQEVLDLANLCGNSPEIILIVFLNFFSEKNTYLEKLVKKLLKERTNSQINQNKVLSGALKNFPKEIIFLLERINYLPEEGFSIKEAHAFCKDLFEDSKTLERVLDALIVAFSLRRKKGKGPKSYHLPKFLKDFLKASFSKKEESLERSYKHILIQRLTNSLYWKADVLWEGQINRAIRFLELFSKSHQLKDKTYFVLHLQSTLLELGFWREVQAILSERYQRAINTSVNNEDRGYWYTIKGSLYQGISRYTRSYKDLQTGLIDFQRALKFYNPQKVPKKYVFIYRNIGKIYAELASLRNLNELDFLRDSAKNYYKAFEYCQVAKEAPAKISNIQGSMAKIYRKIADKKIKPFENYLRAFEFLQKSKLNLIKNNLILLDTKGLLKELDLIKKGLLDLKQKIDSDPEKIREINEVLEGIEEESKSVLIKFN